MTMPSYLVTISQTILVEAEDENEAKATAVYCFDFGSTEVEIEEIGDDV
jgi:hypothetical protein